MWRMLFFRVVPAMGFYNPTIGADNILHIQSNSLYAVNRDGSTKWIFDGNAPLGPHAEGLNSNHVVYVPTKGCLSEAGTLFSLDSWDGSIKWQHQLDGNRQVEDVLVADGTIYLTSRSCPLHNICNDTIIDAIDTTGAGKWTFFISDCGSLSAVGDDGTLFVKSSKSLHALQSDTGHVKWSVALDDRSWQFTDDHVFLLQDDHVFLLQGDNNRSVLSSLSNEDGSILWMYNHSFSDKHLHWMSLGRNNEVYVNGVTLMDGTCGLRVIDFNGNALRNLPCLSNLRPHYSAVEDMFVTVSNLGTWPNEVLAHSGTDGSLLWNVFVHDFLWDDAYFGQDGTVFVWSASGSVDAHAYALRNGKVAWSVQTGGASQQLMWKDGTTYVQGWVELPTRPVTTGLEIVAVAVDGVEKWRYTPTEAAAELV